MPDRSQIQAEAQRILKILQETPFEECQPLSEKFGNLTKWAGIYGIKHQEFGILYIGKSKTIRHRFRTGHPALVKAFIKGLNRDDVRIVVVPPLSYEWIRLLSELEAMILRETCPPYNDRIPQEQ